MLTVADENMPFAEQAFGTLGQVRSLGGRKITRDSLAGADILAVRSVTRVNESLLDGTAVRFVGTATIGVDHIDTGYLQRSGIGFASAPGCNAVSVAEYVTAALLVLAGRQRFSLQGRSLGIVGVGNVGSRVSARAEALGMKVIWNDPPLAEKTGDRRYRPLGEALGADIVTLHVPLNREGPYATFHLADESFLGRMSKGSILINTSRGAVADTVALTAALGAGHLSDAVLDVWENEPGISLDLLEAAAIGTPHIAGYSFDGKVRGTCMIYEAACRYFGLEAAWDPSSVMPPPSVPSLHVTETGRSTQEVLADVVSRVYEITADHARLREILKLNPGERGSYFDRLRREYPVRREFPAFTVHPDNPSSRAATALKDLGFQVKN